MFGLNVKINSEQIILMNSKNLKFLQPREKIIWIIKTFFSCALPLKILTLGSHFDKVE